MSMTKGISTLCLLFSFAIIKADRIGAINWHGGLNSPLTVSPDGPASLLSRAQSEEQQAMLRDEEIIHDSFGSYVDSLTTLVEHLTNVTGSQTDYFAMHTIERSD